MSFDTAKRHGIRGDMHGGSFRVSGRLALGGSVTALAVLLLVAAVSAPRPALAASVIPTESACQPACADPTLDAAEDSARGPVITRDLDTEANPLRKYAPIQTFLRFFGAGDDTPVPAAPGTTEE